MYSSLPVDAPTLIFVSSEGGIFKARLTFPPEFPLLPPKMRFITPMWHPNSASLSTLLHLTFTETYASHSISRRTRVHLYPCERHIQPHFPSVAELNSRFPLPKHAPGDDQYGYEDAGERWMPVQSIESIVRVVHIRPALFY